ncbi:MAG TPA: exodeoxyribonuclease III [Anaeromyxobacteraceae bacterium]|jgi:exodeoxyribonuclease-3|nr:exodeoxyribonuclease III [Anaeromyxobacteraceae bacterium]
MKLATWNVNGIRAREAQVQAFLAEERPDVLCLQELKAPVAKVPATLCDLAGYHCYWHGETAYSGVALLVRRELCGERPAFFHPAFDHETRIVAAALPNLTVASIYVPNGGKDLAAKLRFLEALGAWVDQRHAAGERLVLAGDLNVAHTDLDVHERERKPTAIGQLPEERALFDRLLARGLVDLTRALHPGDGTVFSWWAPWRNLRQRNIGWRIDYLLASVPLLAATRGAAPRAAYGTSDHAPVVAELAL